MNQLTETQKAYLAGFFDGEGCISITVSMDRTKGKTPRYRVHVVITQKNPETLLELHQMAGIGNVYDRRSNARFHASSWQISHLQSREFLTVLLPYLRNKKKEAELAIEFINKFNQSTRDFSTKGRYFEQASQEIIDERERYRVELSRMKGTSSATRGRPNRTMGEASKPSDVGN